MRTYVLAAILALLTTGLGSYYYGRHTAHAEATSTQEVKDAVQSCMGAGGTIHLDKDMRFLGCDITVSIVRQ